VWTSSIRCEGSQAGSHLSRGWWDLPALPGLRVMTLTQISSGLRTRCLLSLLHALLHSMPSAPESH
jgi:hypothetical protein